jgi:transcription elongation factor Elf1
MEEKEYFCRGCGKILKESMLVKSAYSSAYLSCPFCEYVYYTGISKTADEVDWANKVSIRKGIFTGREERKK